MNSNPLFQQYGNTPQVPQAPQNITPPADFLSRFQQFRQNINGNPQQIVQQMMNSGRITQEQFNRAAQIANQMMRFIR